MFPKNHKVDNPRVSEIFQELKTFSGHYSEYIKLLKEGISLTSFKFNPSEVRQFTEQKENKLKEVYSKTPTKDNLEELLVFNKAFPNTFQKVHFSKAWKEFFYQEIHKPIKRENLNIIFKHLVFHFKPVDFEKIKTIPTHLWQEKLVIDQKPLNCHVLSKLENDTEIVEFAFLTSKGNKKNQVETLESLMTKGKFTQNAVSNLLTIYEKNQDKWYLDFDPILNRRKFWHSECKLAHDPVQNWIGKYKSMQRKINEQLFGLCLSKSGKDNKILRINDYRRNQWCEKLATVNSSATHFDLLEEKYPSVYLDILLYTFKYQIIPRIEGKKPISYDAIEYIEAVAIKITEWLLKHNFEPNYFLNHYADEQMKEKKMTLTVTNEEEFKNYILDSNSSLFLQDLLNKYYLLAQNVNTSKNLVKKL